MLMALGVGVISSVTFHILTDDPGNHIREVNIIYCQFIKPIVQNSWVQVKACG